MVGRIPLGHDSPRRPQDRFRHPDSLHRRDRHQAPAPTPSGGTHNRRSESGRSACSRPEAARSGRLFVTTCSGRPISAQATSSVVVPPSSSTVSPSSRSAAACRPIACFSAVAVAARSSNAGSVRTSPAYTAPPCVRFTRPPKIKRFQVAADRALRDRQRPSQRLVQRGEALTRDQIEQQPTTGSLRAFDPFRPNYGTTRHQYSLAFTSCQEPADRMIELERNLTKFASRVRSGYGRRLRMRAVESR